MPLNTTMYEKSSPPMPEHSPAEQGLILKKVTVQRLAKQRWTEIARPEVQ